LRYCPVANAVTANIYRDKLVTDRVKLSYVDHYANHFSTVSGSPSPLA